MRSVVRRLVASSLALLLAASAAAAAIGPREERLREAKALFFDRRYAEARAAWTGIREAGGPDAEAAAYWIARCSEKLGEGRRALAEYAAYLALEPRDALLAEEARVSRVGLAARLYEEGDTRHLGVLERALSDPSRTVSYYAALQLSRLGAGVGGAAIPVLKRIVAEESDPDLVDRARLGLLRLDPAALRESGRGGTRDRRADWLKLRIDGSGEDATRLSLDVPLALAELVFKSLPDEARAELELRGYDADNFFERLRGLGGAEILEIEDDDGTRIRIWIE